MRLVLALLLWLAALPACAQANQQADAAPLQFRDAAEETRFHDLAAELRCVMCQNQSLADSNALIALELRREVLDLIRAGKTDAQVKDHLVQRYGEFVLYRPEVASNTWLLWFGPGLVLLGGGLVVWRIVRRRAATVAATGEANGNEGGEQEW